MIKMDDTETPTIATTQIVPKPMNHGRIPWPGGPSKKQNWALPESIILYMANNPTTAEVYQKMIQSCKFFFETNPVLVVKKLDSCKNGSNIVICPNTFDQCCMNDEKCCIKTDLNKISSKIWLTHDLCVEKENHTSLFLQKLYRCEVAHLSICRTTIMFDDFKILASSAKEIILRKNSIKYNDGKTVMLDKILECLPPVVEEFNMRFGDVSLVNASTIENIMKLQNLQNLKRFKLYKIPESFPVELFSDFLKKYKNTKFWLYFNDHVSQRYKNRLHEFVDTVIESEIPSRYIRYEGQNEGKHKILLRRFNF